MLMQQYIPSQLSCTSFLEPFLKPFLTDHVPSVGFIDGLPATSVDFNLLLLSVTIFLVFCSPSPEA